MAATVAIVAAMALAATFAFVRLRTRFGTARALPAFLARCAVFTIALAALLDPSCVRRGSDGRHRKVAILADVSGSMATPDRPDGSSRASAAKSLAESLRKALPAQTEIVTIPFPDSQPDADSAIASPAGRADIAGALSRLADTAGDADAAILVTDGGEAPVGARRLPRAHFAVLGAGSDLSKSDNIRIASIDAPDRVEPGSSFAIAANAIATGSDDFLASLSSAVFSLERRSGGGAWTEIASATADLSSGSARVEFSTSEDAGGSAALRIRAHAAPGEISPADNSFATRVEVRRDVLNVLYFSCRLGADLKTLRNELSSDPSIAFTAAYRVGGAKFAVQGDDPERTALFAEGLPASVEKLRRFDAIIMGSFPADAFEPAQEEAILGYVDGGGGIIWLGGEESFEGGGYGESALAPLFPWIVAGSGDTLRRGEFAVSIPSSAALEPAVAGLGDILSECMENGAPLSVGSLNAVPSLRTSAQALLEADDGEGRSPLAAQMPVGAGRSIAIASNTTWQWGRMNGPSAEFYRRFWRQAVRAAAGRTDGGQFLRIAWNPSEPQPGGAMEATVTAADPAGVSVRATLADDSGEHPVSVSQGERPGSWGIAMTLAQSGIQRFRLVAERNGETVEVFERDFDLEPLQEEGYSLARRDADLRALAGKAGGIYRPDEQAGELVATVAAWCSGSHSVTRVQLTSAGPWFALALLLACVAEWALRRARGLV